MAEVVKLVPNHRRAFNGVMTALKIMRAAAKADGFTGIAIAAVDKAGYTHTAFEAGENISMLIGATERVNEGGLLNDLPTHVAKALMIVQEHYDLRMSDLLSAIESAQEAA